MLTFLLSLFWHMDTTATVLLCHALPQIVYVLDHKDILCTDV